MAIDNREKIFITDSQVHIWCADTPERPWRAGERSHRQPLGADELLREMDAAGVHRAVLVPPFLDGDRNDLVLEAARLHPDRFAAMGRVDLDAPASRELIPTWRQQPGMLGFRYPFHRPLLTSALTEERVDWLWEGAEKAGVPIMIHAPHAMVHLFDRVAERYPGLRLVMDHLALPMRKQDEEAFRDLDKLLAIAKRPNVAVKTSALPCYTSDPYPYRRLHPYIRRVYDAFGPQRMFWGSDMSRLPCTYRQAITMFTEEMPWLSTDDLDWIMGRGLSEWLGWKPPLGTV
ncbi:MAG: amidohydrolase [Betaproteobacteria bacterium]|nr:amidohydrolase [Betaproteobacteria bacterium]